jgi:hypothetical protein
MERAVGIEPTSWVWKTLALPLSYARDYKSVMTDHGFNNRIGHLESHIEELARTIERCGKSMLMAKIAAIAGAVWLVVMAIGVVRFNGLGLIVSLSAMIGGFVLHGSSRSTSLQAAAALEEAETERRALIGALELRTIDELQAPSIAGSRLLH